MTNSFCSHTRHRWRLPKTVFILVVIGSVWFGGCDYITESDDPKLEKTLFPELAPGSYFGEIVIAGKRQREVERLPLLVVVQQAGRLSWSVGDYTVRDIENSYSGVANLLLPFTLELKEGIVELAWNKPRCGAGEQCDFDERAFRWQGDVIWRGASRKKTSITVMKDNVGRVGGWFLKPLIDEPDRVQKVTSEAEPPDQKNTVAIHDSAGGKSASPAVATVIPPAGEMLSAVQRFDLSGTLSESGFCELSKDELSNLVEKFQSEREELAKQLYYTAKATPAGRLVWLSRLLLSQESLKMRPVAEVAAAPVIDNEIEAERKRLAALQALGIE